MKRARGFIAKGIKRTRHSWDRPGGTWPPKDQRDLYKLTVQDCKDMEQQLLGMPICFEHNKSVAQGYVTMSKFDLNTGDWEVEFELGNKDGTENGATQHLATMMKATNPMPLGLSLSHMAVHPSQGKPRPNEISICFTPQREGCYITNFNGEQYTSRGYERGQVTVAENNNTLEVNASTNKTTTAAMSTAGGDTKNFPPPNPSKTPVDGGSMDTSTDAPKGGSMSDEWDAVKAQEAIKHFDNMKDEKAKQLLLTVQRNAQEAKKAAQAAADEKKKAEALAAKVAELERKHAEGQDVTSLMASEWARTKQLSMDQTAKLRAYIASAPPELSSHMQQVLVDASVGVLQQQQAREQQQQMQRQQQQQQPSQLAQELMGYVGAHVQQTTAVDQRHHAKVFQSQGEIDEATLGIYNPFKGEIAVNASFTRMSKEEQAAYAPRLPPSLRPKDVDDFNARRVHMALQNYRSIEPNLREVFNPKEDATLYANMKWHQLNAEEARLQGESVGTKRRRVDQGGRDMMMMQGLI